MKYVGPILGVITGLLASYGLQAAGVEPLVAKIVGVIVAVAVFLAYGRWTAR